MTNFHTDTVPYFRYTVPKFGIHIVVAPTPRLNHHIYSVTLCLLMSTRLNRTTTIDVSLLLIVVNEEFSQPRTSEDLATLEFMGRQTNHNTSTLS